MFVTKPDICPVAVHPDFVVAMLLLSAANPVLTPASTSSLNNKCHCLHGNVAATNHHPCPHYKHKHQVKSHFIPVHLKKQKKTTHNALCMEINLCTTRSILFSIKAINAISDYKAFQSSGATDLLDWRARQRRRMRAKPYKLLSNRG